MTVRPLVSWVRSFAADRFVIWHVVVGVVVALVVGVVIQAGVARHSAELMGNHAERAATTVEEVLSTRVAYLRGIADLLDIGGGRLEDLVAGGDGAARFGSFETLAYVAPDGSYTVLCVRCAFVSQQVWNQLIVPTVSTALTSGVPALSFDPASGQVAEVIPLAGRSQGALVGMFALAPVIESDEMLSLLSEGMSMSLALSGSDEPPIGRASSASREVTANGIGLVVTLTDDAGGGLAGTTVLAFLATLLIVLASGVATHQASERHKAAVALELARAAWDVPVGVFVNRIDGQLVAVNDAFVEMYGFESKAQALSQETPSLWASHRELEKAVELLRQHGHVDGYEIDLERFDGTPFPAKLWVRMVPETGEMRGTVLDVTEGRKARLELEKSRDRFAALFEFSPIALRMLDMTPAVAWLGELSASGVTDLVGYLAEHPDEAFVGAGRMVVTAANLASGELFGIDSDDLLGLLSDQPSVTATTPGAAAAILGALAAEKYEHTMDGDLMRADGTLRNTQLRYIAPSIGSRPDYSHVVAAYVDITEIEQARRRAVELSQLKSRLIASVSHELRTPLTAVVGFSNLLESDWLSMTDTDVDEMVSLIASTSRQMGGIVEDLLASARADLGDLAVATSLMSVHDAIDEALATVDLVGREISVVGEDVHAWADAGRVRQIVRNMVTNAVRHGAGSIRVEADTEPNMAVLRVCDRGAGVSSGSEEKIFEPYWTSGQAAGHTESVGLGLSLSRLLARRMGGDLTYRRLNHETVFELTLPTQVESVLLAG